MKCRDKVDCILREKGREVYAISPGASVFEAIEKMADRHIGSLVVLDDHGHLIGVLSERDYARKVILKARSSRETYVRDIMTHPVITISHAATIDECMRAMTDHRVRHLPVLDNDKVVGVISQGDIVNYIITVQDQAIEQLEHYIAGQYPC